MGMEHDNAVDKVLAALRDAVPPEGMDARIAQRLEQQAKTAQDAAFRWRDLLAGSALAGAWWRGAISGAATAMLVTGAVLFAGHLLRPRTLVPDNVQLAVRETSAPAVTPVNASILRAPVSEDRAKPCATPSVLRVRTDLPPQTAETLRTESYTESTAPSRPAPAMPLTAQERQLVHLARTADPQELAKLQAEDAAEFAKFFATPPPPPVPEISPEASPDVNQEASPEVIPPVSE
jgi:hypothetical protein